MLLVLILLYWLTVIIGLFDLDFLDLDLDLDLDAGEGSGFLDAIALFFGIGEIPFGLVLSLTVLNFWLIAMFLYFLPISPSSVLYGLLLIPVLMLAMVVTGYELRPLRVFFRSAQIPNDLSHKVMDRRCVLICDVSSDRIGQARISQRGAGIVINVTPEFDGDQFKKDEVAFVFRKDEEKDLYYITKPIV